MLDIQNKFAILVVSCDKYSDLWNPFFKSFLKFWPDCPFNIYLLSNYKYVNIPKVRSLSIGDDISWSDNLYKGINSLKEDYIFLFLEDLFLVDFVETSKILNIFTWIMESNANYVRINPSATKADKKFNDLVGIISKGTIYRTSTVLSIWKKDILLNLLKANESAWDFEIYGSLRSDIYDGFYATWRKYFSIINAIIKGKWQRKAIRKLNSIGIEIDLDNREIMTFGETIKYYFISQRSKLLKFIPSKYRRNLKDFILRGKYNYKRLI
jgi:hypothetical protein